jgi:uncharacterized protein YxjI
MRPTAGFRQTSASEKLFLNGENTDEIETKLFDAARTYAVCVTASENALLIAVTNAVSLLS